MKKTSKRGYAQKQPADAIIKLFSVSLIWIISIKNSREPSFYLKWGVVHEQEIANILGFRFLQIPFIPFTSFKPFAGILLLVVLLTLWYFPLLKKMEENVLRRNRSTTSICFFCSNRLWWTLET